MGALLVDHSGTLTVTYDALRWKRVRSVKERDPLGSDTVLALVELARLIEDTVVTR